MPYKKGDEPVPGYRLIKLLGRGGFGEVWHATAPGNVPAALKIISLTSDQGYKEFRAIRLVKHIHHPNLVPTTGFWLKDEEGKLFDEERGGDTLALRSHASELLIAMGLGDQNLFDRLQECQKEGKPGIPSEELLDYLEPAAKAIDFLNQSSHDLGTGTSGIQHCDIKPQNILIVGGSAQVCDFGLARVLGESHHTQVGGTAFYTAPEVLSGNQPSKFTDQYSLAISYYHLLTGTLPFDARAQTGAMLAHLYGKLDFGKVTEAEQAVLKRATTVDPIKRFPSCLEMVRELRRARERGSSKRPSSSQVGLVEVGLEIVPGYKVVRLIGKGGYGEVWEAVAPGGKHVALKVIRNLECAKGLQEFKSLEVIKGVEHNNLIELHAYWILDKEGEVIPDEMRDRSDAPAPGMLIIASRLAHKNLLDRLKECRKLGHAGIPAPELIHYMTQVAAAIDHLNTPQHPMGDQLIAIQHRDIKPENILLSRDNTIKLADFGLAKVLEDSQAMVHPSSAGLTPAYAAPEMIMGTVTSWSDQYSLAITYHHLRTGTMPFPKGIPFNELILLHLHGKLDFTQLPESERAVIARATTVKPEERFPDCASMVRVLQKAVGLPSMWEFELPRSNEFDLGPIPTPPPSTSRDSDSKQLKGTDKMSAPPTPVSPPPVPLPTPIIPTPTPILASGEVAPATCTMPAALKEKLAPAARAPGDTDLEFKSDTRPAPGVKPRSESDLEVSVKPTTIDFPAGMPGAPSPEPKRKATQPAIEIEPDSEPAPELETLRPKPAPKSWHEGKKKKTKSTSTVKEQPSKPPSKQVVKLVPIGSVVLRIAIRVTVAVGVLLAAAGGGWMMLGTSAKSHVRSAIDKKEFADALNSTRKWYVSDATRKTLRADVLQAWLAWADQQTKDGKVREACGEFKKIREEAADDADVVAKCDQGAQNAGVNYFKRLLEDKSFEKAVGWARDPDWAAAAKPSLEATVKAEWLAEARRSYANKQYQTAKEQTGRYLNLFEGDADARQILTDASRAVIDQEVSKLLANNEVEPALDRLKAEGGQLEDRGAKLKQRALEKGTQLALELEGRSGEGERRTGLLKRLHEEFPRDARVSTLYEKSLPADLAFVSSQLREAEAALVDSPDKALKLYNDLAGKNMRPADGALVAIGQARAHFRMRQLTEARSKLDAVADDKLDADSKDKVLAQKYALKALVDADKETDPVKRLGLLKPLQPNNINAQIPEWEKKKVEALARTSFEKVDLAKATPDRVIELADVVLAFEPNNVEILRTKADGQRQKRAYDESLATLTRAESTPEGAKNSVPINELKVLVYAQQGKLPQYSPPNWTAIETALKSNHWNSEEKKQVETLREKLGGAHFQELVAAADAQYEAAKYDSARANLQEAESFAAFAKPDDRSGADVLRVLATLKDPRAPGRDAAAKRVPEFLQVGKPNNRLVELFVVYGREAASDGSTIDRAAAKQTLAQAVALVPEGRRAEINGVIESLGKALTRIAASKWGTTLTQLEAKLAGAELAGDALAAIEKQLEAARSESLPDEERKRLDVLEAVVWTRNPAKRDQAAERLNSLFKDDAPADPVRACQAFAQLAKAEPKYLDPAYDHIQNTLKKATSLPPHEEDKIKANLTELVPVRVKMALAQRSVDWNKLLGYFKDADPSDRWIFAGRIEAELEKGSGGLGRDFENEQKLLFDAGAVKDEADAARYVYYVRARVYAARKQYEKAAGLVEQAYRPEALPDVLKVEARGRRAAEILIAAAAGKRTVATRTEPLAEPFAKAQDADQAYQWLKKAFELSAKGPPDKALATSLAFAAWFGSKHDVAIITALPDVAPPAKGKLSPDDLLYQFVKAKAFEEEKKDLPAMQAYARLAELSSQYEQQIDAPLAPADLLNKVVEPGIAIGEAKLKINDGSNAAQKRSLAKLYMTAGRLLNRMIVRDDKLLADKLHVRWLGDCDKAMALLDPKDRLHADCLVLRDYARMWLQSDRSVAAEQKIDSALYPRPFVDDAQKILDLDRQLGGQIKQQEPRIIAGAHFLLGYVADYEAYRAGFSRNVSAEEMQKLQEKPLEVAQREFTAAIKLVENNDLYRDLPPFYMSRSKNAVYFANRTWLKDDEKRRRLLEQAADDAKKGSEFYDATDREVTKHYVARAIALEDLALHIERQLDKKTARYGEAVRLYKSALDNAQRFEGRVKPRYRIDLGRCEYRAREATKNKPNPDFDNYLKEAEAALTEVAFPKNVEGEAPAPAKEIAEASYWLANVYTLQEGRDKDAEKAFQAVIDLTPSVGDWYYLAIRDAANFALARADKAKMKVGLRKELAESARKYADAYDSYDKTYAALIRAQSYKLDNEPAEAIKALNAALPKDGPTEFDQIPLYVEKFTLLLKDAKSRILIDEKDPVDANAVAKEADAFAEFTDRYAGQALSHELAGLAYREVAKKAKNEEEEREAHNAAMVHFSKAVNKTPAGDANLWRVRFKYAEELAYFAQHEPNETKKTEFRDLARKEAATLDKEAPESEKRRIAELRKQINKE